MPLPLKIGPVELGKRPRIIAVVDAFLPKPELKRQFDQGAAIAEIRFDLLPGDPREALRYAKTVREAASFGILGTLRETPANTMLRYDLFRRFLPDVDAVDIEIDAPINRQVISLSKGKTVIVSHHDFQKTPAETELFSMAENARKQGAHIFKIAAMAKTPDDCTRLLGFIKKSPLPVIVIVMGELGKPARTEALRLGSLAGYAFTGEAPVAPGQLSVAEMAASLK
ncbi:MAG: type I 3-dehydroquinate dehydratase [Fibrobacterota bacterium]